MDQPGFALLIALGGAMGAAMGALMGAVQIVGAGGKLSRVRWVFFNALGWAPAMAIIMLAATSTPGPGPLYGVTLVGAAAGGIAGALVGAVTFLTLPVSEPLEILSNVASGSRRGELG